MHPAVSSLEPGKSRPRLGLALLAWFAMAPGLPAQGTSPGSSTAPGVVQAPPVEVTGATPERLRASGTRLDLENTPGVLLTPEGLAEEVPNFSVATAGARGFGDIYSLRGLTNTPFFGPPAVTVYLDDLPLPRAFMFPSELFGWSQAEICRGPNVNASFGRVGPAGVLQLTSPPFNGEEPNELRVGLGRHATRTLAARATASAGLDVDLQGSVAYAARDGYIKNTQLGKRVDDRESLAARGRADWRATSQLTFSAQAYGLRSRDGAQPLVPLGGPLFTVERGREGVTDVETGGGAITAIAATPVGRLTATTSYSLWRLGPYSNRLVLPPPLDSIVGMEQTGWTEEIRLASASGSAWSWQAGVYWNDQDTSGSVHREIPDLFPIEESSYQLDTRTLAAFGEVSLAPAPGWTITPGLRIEENRSGFDRGETIPSAGRFRSDARSSALLPTLSVRWSASPATTYELIAGAGYKPGGFSAFTGRRDLAEFGPERTRSVELDAHHELADGRFIGTARLFWYAIDGYQIERSFTETDYLVVNAARARSRGAEAELAWRPAPAWRLAVNAGFTDSTLRAFADPFTGTHYDGNRTPATPRFDAGLQVDWHAVEGWFAGVRLTAFGRSFYDESENPAFAQGSYALLGAHLGYSTPRYQVTLWGENLTDRGYFSSITPGVFHGTPGAPLTWGVEAAWHF